MSRAIRVLVPALACGFMFLTSACDSGAGGLTAAPFLVPNKAAPSTASGTKPSISNPLSVAKLKANPCGVLTTADLEPYIGDSQPGELMPAGPGTEPECAYRAIDVQHEGSIYLTSMSGDIGLLDPSVAGSAYERAPEVSGYPAVHYMATETGGSCATEIGVSNKDVVRVAVVSFTDSWKYQTTPCTVSDALAPYVIAYLKSGS